MRSVHELATLGWCHPRAQRRALVGSHKQRASFIMSDEIKNIAHNMGAEDNAAKKEKERKKRQGEILEEQWTALAREYRKLANRFERAKIEHKLAVEYFAFRSFYFNFLPTTLIACATTIIGFLIHGSVKSSIDQGSDVAEGVVQESFEPLFTGQSANVWSIVVGILGAISTLLTTIGKHTNYQSQCDMHQSAVKALEKICLHVSFEHDWFERKVKSDDFKNSSVKKRMNTPPGAEYEDLSTVLGSDLKSHQASFEAMQNACCDSPVPNRVIQAFEVLDRHHDEGRCTDKDLILYYHKLWKEFSVYPWWPLKVPSINVIEQYDK